MKMNKSWLTYLFLSVSILWIMPSVVMGEIQKTVPEGTASVAPNDPSLAGQEKPRILFMVAEQNIGQEIAFFWWSFFGPGGSQFRGQTVDMAVTETVLKDEFLQKGFDVVDISVVTGTFEVSNAYRVADLSSEGARFYGKKMGAEIVIKGKALAKEGPRRSGSSVGSYVADITLSAIRVENGQVLASTRANAAARHVTQHVGGNEALSRAAKNAAAKLLDQLSREH